MITENSIKHLKMTCKFNWCSISWSNVGITRSISWLNMNEWKLLGVCLCREGGDLGLGSGFVYLIPCWVVMLSDRYMYKLSEPWENHRSCCRFSSRAASSQTPLMNANWVVFSPFCMNAFRILRDFCVLLWNWHLLLRVSDCMSVLVNESVKLTLLRGVFAQSKTEHWTHLSASGLMFRPSWVLFRRAHSNSLTHSRTLFNCWIKSTG